MDEDIYILFNIILFGVLNTKNESEVKTVDKSYQYRIYPNNKQKEIISKTFGCCRFVYNKYLAKRIEMYK
jgi:hypothetical protein